MDVSSTQSSDILKTFNKYQYKNLDSTSSSVRVTTELHEKHAHAYLVIAVLLSGQSTRLLLHGTKNFGLYDDNLHPS